MTYTFKFWQELAWAVAITVLVTVAQALITFDASAITDWHVWALGLFSGCIRAASAVIVAQLSGKLVFRTE